MYTDEEIKTVKHLAKLDFPPAFVLLELGLRRGELCGLMWKDINFKAKTLRIERTVRVTSGIVSIAEPKHGSYRVLPISSEMLEVLRYIDRKSVYVFPNNVGKPWDPNGFARALKKFMESLPSCIPRLTAHELRHTCGTALRRRGVDIYTIEKFLGHRDIDVTANTYVHNEVEALRKSIGE